MPTTDILLGTPTATDPVTERDEIAPAPLNFGADWRVVSEKAGEVVLTNIKAGLDTPTTLRVAFSEISDVFKGSSLTANPNFSKSGSSVLLQLNTVGEYVSEISEIFHFPISAHLVLKVPTGMPISSEDVDEVLAYLVGALMETGDASSDNRVDALLRGVVKPFDL